MIHEVLALLFLHGICYIVLIHAVWGEKNAVVGLHDLWCDVWYQTFHVCFKYVRPL